MGYLASDKRRRLVMRIDRFCRSEGISRNTFRKKLGLTCSSFYRLFSTNEVHEKSAVHICSKMGWSWTEISAKVERRRNRSVLWEHALAAFGGDRTRLLMDRASSCYSWCLKEGWKPQLAADSRVPDVAMVCATIMGEPYHFTLSLQKDYVELTLQKGEKMDLLFQGVFTGSILESLRLSIKAKTGAKEISQVFNLRSAKLVHASMQKALAST